MRQSAPLPRPLRATPVQAVVVATILAGVVPSVAGALDVAPLGAGGLATGQGMGETVTALVALAAVALVLLAVVLAQARRLRRLTALRLESQAEVDAERRAGRDQLAVAALELERVRAAAARADAAKTDFLATMSHEIRTPLGGLVGAAQMLAANPTTPQRPELCAMIQDSAAALARLVDDVLDLSKLDAGRLSLLPVDFRLDRLVAEAVQLMGVPARTKGLELRCDCDPAAAATFHGDPQRLRQILLNLLGNAIKFTERGGVTIGVAVHREGPADGADEAGREVPARVVITVSDTGIGLTAEQQARLFTRFGQADAAIQKQFGGTGLGLAICRELVTLMRGSIGVDSRPGQGATFFVDLPLPLRPGAPAPAPTGLATPLPERGRGRRVLVVEDNPINARLTQMMLAAEGYEVAVAHDGEGGAAIATTTTFDLVLMDIEMAGIDGVDAVARIRAGEALQGGGRHVPVVAMTAHALAGRREEYLGAGFDDYLAKPFEQRPFLDLVARWTAIAPSPATAPADDGAGTPPGTPVARPLYDPGPLAKLIDLAGRDGTQDMVRQFVGFGRARLDRLRAWVAAGDLSAARKEAHSLVSTVGNLGLRRLQDQVAAVESACGTGDDALVARLADALPDLARLSWAALAADFPGVAPDLTAPG